MLPVSLCTASSSAQSPSNFLVDDWLHRFGIVVGVTSLDALRSFLRPVHCDMDEFDNIALEEMDEIEGAGAAGVGLRVGVVAGVGVVSAALTFSVAS